MEIAVLGGGNGSHAAAADLTEAGHRVRFWRRDAEAVAALKEAGNRLVLKDYRGERQVDIALVTADIGEALTGAALAICPAPAFAQESIAAAIAPHLADGQVVFLPPGTFGSYVMARTARARGSRARVAFAEAGTLPYLTRKHGPGAIAIATRATRLPTGVFPLAEKERALTVIRSAYPSVEDAGDALSGALMNAGPIIHPPLITMNAGPIEHFEHWDIHNEGTTPSIRRVTDALDAERIAVRATLGYGPPHFPLRDHYQADGDEWMYGNLAHDRLVSSGDWRERLVLTEHRYMREDIAYGLAFLVSVAEWADVHTPVARGLLALGSAVCGEDFRASGRTLERLDLAGLDRQAMRTLLAEGLTR
ncbi:MAG: NAD/NADP octopine/nopaline dehydrogenase family protein [Betaproteobacteria bacterium]|jgi:opine dehydrogenase|nr:NAD/NADP octopine/nopaline dehydrogenase family protein [Betaproteobacteria bacterium]